MLLDPGAVRLTHLLVPHTEMAGRRRCRVRGAWSIDWDPLEPLLEPILDDVDLGPSVTGRVTGPNHEEPLPIGGNVEGTPPPGTNRFCASKSSTGFPGRKVGSVSTGVAIIAEPGEPPIRQLAPIRRPHRQAAAIL